MEGDSTKDHPKDSSTLPNNTASNLSRDVLLRRKHYEKTCSYIAARRDGLYGKIPINHLVPLVFHTTPTLLENFQDANAVVQDVSEQYKKNKSDLFGDWQKYCKALDSHQRAAATFEGAIFFAAESILGSQEREAWISSCLDHLHLLKRLSCINEGDGRGSKRKRGAGQEGNPNASDGRNRVIRTRSIETTEAPAAVNLQAGNALSLDSPLSQPLIGPMCQGGATEEASTGAANLRVVPQAQNAGQIEASDMEMALIARMAEVDKLESILGGYLFEGMKASRMRKGEEDRRSMRLTDTVRLHPAHKEGEDFKLEVWLGSLTGKAISQAKMRSVEDLKNMLGDYLFDAMKASNRRKEEERTGMSAYTGAADVSFPSVKDSSDDSKLEVMLNFETGRYVYAEAYPS